MKLGLDDSYIDATDLGNVPNDLSFLRIGDSIYNSQGEFLYYQGNNKFLFANNSVGSYIINPDGPWYSSSSLVILDSRSPIQKIKEWVFSNF